MLVSYTISDWPSQCELIWTMIHIIFCLIAASSSKTLLPANKISSPNCLEKWFLWNCTCTSIIANDILALTWVINHVFNELVAFICVILSYLSTRTTANNLKFLKRNALIDFRWLESRYRCIINQICSIEKLVWSQAEDKNINIASFVLNYRILKTCRAISCSSQELLSTII